MAKKQRFVAWPKDHHYYSVFDERGNDCGVKGATFLDTKTGTVYLVTASTSSLDNFDSPDGYKYVRDTVEQFAEGELLTKH